MSASIFADDFRQQPCCRVAGSPEEPAANQLPDTAEVAIAGSGYAGPCCAIELAAAGASVVVVEAAAIRRCASARHGPAAA